MFEQDCLSLPTFVVRSVQKPRLLQGHPAARSTLYNYMGIGARLLTNTHVGSNRASSYRAPLKAAFPFSFRLLQSSAVTPHVVNSAFKPIRKALRVSWQVWSAAHTQELWSGFGPQTGSAHFRRRGGPWQMSCKGGKGAGWSDVRSWARLAAASNPKPWSAAAYPQLHHMGPKGGTARRGIRS